MNPEETASINTVCSNCGMGNTATTSNCDMGNIATTSNYDMGNAATTSNCDMGNIATTSKCDMGNIPTTSNCDMGNAATTSKCDMGNITTTSKCDMGTTDSPFKENQSSNTTYASYIQDTQSKKIQESILYAQDTLKRARFPEKLYTAACNQNIDFIFWSENGQHLFVQAKDFEANVMKFCPGLVKVPSFKNLRRQFRVYGFTVKLCTKPWLNEYEIAHPEFVRNIFKKWPNIVDDNLFVMNHMHFDREHIEDLNFVKSAAVMRKDYDRQNSSKVNHKVKLNEESGGKFAVLKSDYENKGLSQNQCDKVNLNYETVTAPISTELHRTSSLQNIPPKMSQVDEIQHQMNLSTHSFASSESNERFATCFNNANPCLGSVAHNMGYRYSQPGVYPYSMNNAVLWHPHYLYGHSAYNVSQSRLEAQQDYSSKCQGGVSGGVSGMSPPCASGFVSPVASEVSASPDSVVSRNSDCLPTNHMTWCSPQNNINSYVSMNGAVGELLHK